jgi:DNA-binding NtrC family response regulator
MPTEFEDAALGAAAGKVTVQVAEGGAQHTLPVAAPEALESRHYLLVFEEGRAWMHPLPARGEVLIGRADSCDLEIADVSVSRQHLRVSLDGVAVQIADLGSQNGTRINGEPLVGSRSLASGDTLTVGNVTLVFHSDARSAGSERLVPLAQFRERCEEELERALRYSRPLTVVCLTLGTAVDRPLVAAALKGRLRLLDLVAWGGQDAMLALLPETGGDRAPVAAERLVSLLEGCAPEVRAGVASCPTDGCDVATLLASARAAASASSPQRVAIASQAFRELSLAQGQVALVADPVMARLYGLVERLALSDLPVLVGGETGSGKELVASAIHHFSPRRHGPLLTVNCAALTESLLEGELFGWERGAFSGAVAARAGHLESAAGGTIFLDEVGELTAAAQGKLLRVIETKRVMRLGDSRERPIDIRLVAATNRDLEEEVRRGHFRQDLFFRLTGARLWIPPLRDRPRELPLLARRFLDDACQRLGREPLVLAPDTMRLLAAHTWPGNVRELRNLSEFLAATVQEGPVIGAHLPEGLIPSRPAFVARGTGTIQPPGPAQTVGAASFRPLEEELRELERCRIAAALEHTGGNQTRAAQLLGVPRRTFVSKLREYGLGGGSHGS